jgi:hypothetical protein
VSEFVEAKLTYKEGEEVNPVPPQSIGKVPKLISGY